MGEFIEQHPGKRTDLDTVAEKIQGGATVQQIAADHPKAIILHSKGIEKLRSFCVQPREEMTICHVYWGATGTGKSRRALWEAIQKYGKEEVYVWSNTKHWWNGYDGHKAVIMNDFDTRDSGLSAVYMKNLIDVQPCKVETKGGMVEFVAKEVWITTNMFFSREAPWWNDKAWDRRVAEAVEFKEEDGVWAPPYEHRDMQDLRERLGPLIAAVGAPLNNSMDFEEMDEDDVREVDELFL